MFFHWIFRRFKIDRLLINWLLKILYFRYTSHKVSILLRHNPWILATFLQLNGSCHFRFVLLKIGYTFVKSFIILKWRTDCWTNRAFGFIVRVFYSRNGHLQERFKLENILMSAFMTPDRMVYWPFWGNFINQIDLNFPLAISQLIIIIFLHVFFTGEQFIHYFINFAKCDLKQCKKV